MAHEKSLGVRKQKSTRYIKSIMLAQAQMRKKSIWLIKRSIMANLNNDVCLREKRKPVKRNVMPAPQGKVRESGENIKEMEMMGDKKSQSMARRPQPSSLMSHWHPQEDDGCVKKSARSNGRPRESAKISSPWKKPTRNADRKL